MKTPHFFNIQSRLGIQHPPIGSTELNIGVESGGNEILTPDFTFEFDQLNISRVMLPDPDEIDQSDYLGQVVQEYRTVANFLHKNVHSDQIQVVLGGDHSVGLPSLLAVIEREGSGNVGVIMFDSHGDIHLKSTSPTGNIHGMWLRMLTDTFDHPEVMKLKDSTLHTTNVLYVGNLLIEPEEERYITEEGIRVLSSHELATPQAAQDLKTFIKSFPHIHVSFDIDVFSQSVVEATGTPNPRGMTKEEIFPLLELFEYAQDLSIDVVEVNPRKTGAKQTLELSREVLRVLLKQQLNYPLQPII